MTWDIWGAIWFVAGIIVTVVSILATKKTKKIGYDINTQKLITQNIADIKGLEIIFNGNAISNVTATNLIFYNLGSDIIEPTDFASTDPLTIKTDGEFLLSGNINSFITESDKISNLSLSLINTDEVKIDFEFWRKKAKTKLTLLHTGTEIEIRGTLKTGTVQDMEKNNKRSKWISVVGIGLMMGSLIVADYYPGVLILFSGLIIAIIGAFMMILQEATRK